jgi:dTDP-4-dehydrorhamnose reductase
VVGADGQLGRALRRQFAGRADFASRQEVDLADARSIRQVPWDRYDTVVNAAAYSAVDAAETEDGRRAAWAVNVGGVARLAETATQHRLTLVHVSSDYVFDGRKDGPYLETDSACPLGVYGQTKAAADAVAATVPSHYIVRTSWVIGEGRNFVRTMLALAADGVDPQVVDDQVGRLTFTEDLARGIEHLLSTRPECGTLSPSGCSPRAGTIQPG